MCPVIRDARARPRSPKRLGYATTSLRPLDMIPLTEEVETLALLRREGVPAPRVAHEDHEIFVAEKGPHEPTVPQGEYAGSLLARARSIVGAGAAVPGAAPGHRDERTGGLCPPPSARRQVGARADLGAGARDLPRRGAGRHAVEGGGHPRSRERTASSTPPARATGVSPSQRGTACSGSCPSGRAPTRFAATSPR